MTKLRVIIGDKAGASPRLVWLFNNRRELVEVVQARLDTALTSKRKVLKHA